MIQLLERAFDYKRITAKIWYIPMILLMPVATVLSYILMRILEMPLPAPVFPVLPALIMFAVFFIAALGEELGWSGYATDPIQGRSSALMAGIVLGLVWAVWHAIPLLQVGRSVSWVGWWCLGTVAYRIILIWLYNKTGKSVFATAIFHAMINLCWQSFPNQGSHYDPQITSLIAALFAIVIILAYSPMMLSRQSNA